MTGFNLRTIKTVDTVDYDVKDHEGNKTGVTFTLAGPNHKVRKDWEYAQRRKMLAAARKTGKVDALDPEQQDADNLAYVGRAILGWQGFADESGQPVPYTPEEAQRLISPPEMKWLVDQIDRELGNAANFTVSA